MSTWVAIVALVVSIASLIVSVRNTYLTRRTAQFQKLSELRTKAARIRWQMYYRLADVEEIFSELEKHDVPGSHERKESLETLRKLLRSVEDDEGSLADVYAKLARMPVIVPAHLIEGLHTGVDRLAASVEASREEGVPRLRKMLEDIKSLLAETEAASKQLEAAEKSVSR